MVSGTTSQSQVPMEAEMMDTDDAASTRNASEMPVGGQGLQFRQQQIHRDQYIQVPL